MRILRCQCDVRSSKAKLALARPRRRWDRGGWKWLGQGPGGWRYEDKGQAGEGIDSLPLGTAIMVIDAVSLIMAAEQACRHHFRHGAAEVGLAGGAHAQLHFLFDRKAGGIRISGQTPLPRKLCPDARGKGQTPGVASTHWGQGIAQPIAERLRPTIFGYHRPCASVRPRDFRDQGQQHERIARPRACMRKPVEQRGQITAGRRRVPDRTVKHNGNESSTGRGQCESLAA